MAKEEGTDLFAAPSKDEMQTRVENRIRVCVHVWREMKLERIPLLGGWNQITIADQCTECKARKKIVMIIDAEAKVIKDEISLRPWTTQDQEQEDQERRRITELAMDHHYPSLRSMKKSAYSVRDTEDVI